MKIWKKKIISMNMKKKIISMYETSNLSRGVVFHVKEVSPQR